MRTLGLLPKVIFGVATLVPLAVACGGQVSLGTNRTQLSLVDPKVVSGNAGACSAGEAHPNVCCDVGQGKDGTCGIYVGAPFQPCDNGWTTYPDPRTCCSLENPNDCAPTPPNPPPTVGTCTYPCEPGWYPIQNGCCQSTGNGNGVCYGWASDGGYPDAGIDDGGVFDGGAFDAEVDAGTVDSGCTTTIDGGGSCDPQPPQPTPVCNLDCPNGWQHPQGAPDICCRDTGGVIECFSQASGPSNGGSGGSGGGSTDAGVPTVDAGVCGPNEFWDGGCLPCFAADAGPGSCSNARIVNGQCYEIMCGSFGCSCLVDDVVIKNGVAAPNNTCTDTNVFAQQWSATCGFPR